jgi:hypothetical protein
VDLSTYLLGGREYECIVQDQEPTQKDMKDNYRTIFVWKQENKYYMKQLAYGERAQLLRPDEWKKDEAEEENKRKLTQKVIWENGTWRRVAAQGVIFTALMFTVTTAMLTFIRQELLENPQLDNHGPQAIATVLSASSAGALGALLLHNRTRSSRTKVNVSEADRQHPPLRSKNNNRSCWQRFYSFFQCGKKNQEAETVYEQLISNDSVAEATQMI